MKRLFALVCALALTAAPAAANDAARAAKMLKEAKAALAEAVSPKSRLAALGLAAKAQEAVLKALRGDLQALAKRRDALAETREAEERRLSAILAALQRLERSPRAAALAHPGGAVAAARAGSALAAFVPALEVEAAKIRVSLDEIAALEARREVATSEARASLAALREARGEIATLLDRDRRTRSLPEALVAKISAEAEGLSRSAANLAALSTALPPGTTPPGGAPFSKNARGLQPPVEGRLVTAFGETDAPGVRFSAPAYAEVYAPWPGVVRFAGPFGDHGGVVILEPEPGMLMVFGGLGDIWADPGALVLQGQPLGAMGGPAPEADEFLIASGEGSAALGRETLYMEIRENGAPVDPATWFAFVTEGG